MKKTCMLILLITCSMGFTGQPIQSQIALEQHRYKVAVTISSDNEMTKNLVESHIKRELRNLGDVHLTNIEDALYVIQVVALPLKSELTGEETGNISIAYTFLSEERGFIAIKPILRKMIREEKLTEFDNLIKLHSKCYAEPYLGAAYWQKANIDTLCRDIIATFDIRTLEPIRQLLPEVFR